jgi:SUR7/PalI family
MASSMWTGAFLNTILTSHAGSFFAFISLIFTAGALLLMLFIFLAGAIDHSPINKFYFLEASTGNIPGAPAVSRWTFWNICSVSNGRNVCGNVHPAFPLDPPSHRNFNTTVNVPKQFIGTSKYFYMTRFMYAFELIALFFSALALLLGILALCTRIASRLSGALAILGLFFQTIVAALMT